MKYSLIYSFITFVTCISSCTNIKRDVGSLFGFGQRNNSGVDTVLYSKATTIHFQDTMVDIGNVKEGKECSIIYYYQNTGNAPLMLFNVSPSCGCTIAEYSHNPLGPGQKDSIIAKFDSKDKLGSYQKNIKVNCNTNQKVHDLYFKVNVLPR